MVQKCLLSNLCEPNSPTGTSTAVTSGTDQSVDDFMFDCGQHPFKLLRLRGDHSRAQVGVACYRSKRKNTLTNISLYCDILTV